MGVSGGSVSLEEQIEQWRNFLRHRQAIHAVDIIELEDHLREQIAGLVDAGLTLDEAFLVAVKRMGDLDTLSHEFAREHSERLWKQLVIAPAEDSSAETGNRADATVAFCLAVAAALAFKFPVLFGIAWDEASVGFYARNASLFVLPFLAIYFLWKRQRQWAPQLEAPQLDTHLQKSPQLDTHLLGWLAMLFVAAAVFANVYPFQSLQSVQPVSYTEVLSVLHLPIALWIVVGIAYAGHRWRELSGRMDFIRFSGEFFIYYVLMALGGGVLAGFMMMIFGAIGINVQLFVMGWVLPCGAMGAVLVGAWLVEAKQSVIENMAPVLTRLFTPLFAAVLLMFLGALIWTGRGVDIEREVLIGFDLLLLVVLGLLLYSVSARNPAAPPGAFDILQIVLVISALITDAVALWAIAARITEFGLSPNRVAALGVNVILLVNLAWSAVLYISFMRGRGPFTRLEHWQTRYLAVYAAWAAIVVIVFPPAFGFI